jgi:hypothetical protein
VHNNTAVFTASVVNVTINEPLSAAYMRSMLATIASTSAPGDIVPYFFCGQPTFDVTPPTICTVENVTACAFKNCTLFYSEQDASASLVGKPLQVCGIAQQFQSVAYFADPAISQARALRALLDLLGFTNTGPVPQDYCNETEWEKLNDYNNPRGPVFTERWVRECDADGEL